MALSTIELSLPPGFVDTYPGSYYLPREWPSSFWLLPQCTGLVFYAGFSRPFFLLTVVLLRNMLSVKGGEGERL